MPKVDEVKVLNIDGVPHAVDSMSEQVKALVEIYNEWNHDEQEARSRLMQVQAAKNDLSRQIITQVRTEKAQEAEAAEAAKATEGEAPAAAPAAVNTTEAPKAEVAEVAEDQAPAE